MEKSGMLKYSNVYNANSVPTPSSVKISSNTACGSRPSTNETLSTPDLKRGHGAVHFRNHAFVNDAGFFQALDFVTLDAGNDSGRVLGVAHAGRGHRS